MKNENEGNKDIKQLKDETVHNFIERTKYLRTTFYMSLAGGVAAGLMTYLGIKRNEPVTVIAGVTMSISSVIGLYASVETLREINKDRNAINYYSGILSDKGLMKSVEEIKTNDSDKLE